MGTRLDAQLDVNSHDLEVVGFDVPLVGGDTREQAQAYYRQKLKIRLWLFLGEWYLDTSAGTPFHQNILVKNPNIPLIDTILKSRILGTEGVTELKSYESAYDSAQRKLEVTFQAQTDAGLVTVEGTIP